MIDKNYFAIAAILFLGSFVFLNVSADTNVKHSSNQKCELVPSTWQPSLDQVADTLNERSSEDTTQQAMNLSSQNLSDIRDAQLYIVYVQLVQKLDGKSRGKLIAEQQQWLNKRAAKAEAAIVSKGGSLASLEYSSAFIKITEERVSELQKRLQRALSSNNAVKNK